MMKKSYQSPVTEIVEIEASRLLEGSVEGFQQELIDEETLLIKDPFDIL